MSGMNEWNRSEDHSFGPDAEVGYALDGEDRIRYVNRGWNEFALANHGDHLLAPGILGVPLWDTIRDPTTRGVYRALLQRVRGGAGPIRFRLRCDSPDTRRLLEMRISPEDADGVVFGVRTVAVQPRDSMPLFDPDEKRSEEIMTICSWCMRVATSEQEWDEVEHAVPALRLFERDALPRLSHGMCPDCYEAMERALSTPAAVVEDEAIQLGIGLPG